MSTQIPGSTSISAVISLIFGILSWVGLPFFGAVVAIVCGHVARGESDKRIAHHLRISSHAVDYHMRQLRSRFAVHNRVQLAQASRLMEGA